MFVRGRVGAFAQVEEQTVELLEPFQELVSVFGFDVGDVVRAVASQLETEGVEVKVDVAEGLMATGSVAETTEVLRQVVAAARENGDALSLSAAVIEESAVITVGNGPVPDGRLPALLAARRPPWEQGRSLHVAQRLMQEQNGELGVAADGDQGRLFLLRLPAASDDTPNPAAGT